MSIGCREFFSPSDNFSAERTLFLITFLLGLTPFRVSGQIGNRVWSLSRIGYLNTILQVIFFMYCFIYALALQESIVGFFFQSEISRVGDTLQKFIGMLAMLTLFGISLYKCHDVIFLCKSIQCIDERFVNLGVVFNYSFVMKFTLVKLLLVLGINVAYMISSLWLLFLNEIWPSFQAITSFFLPHLFLLTVVVLFSALIMRLQQHFNLINKVSRKVEIKF